jgi:hypothetical protein
MSVPFVDLERLLKLRLVVGRVGEMDRAGWWNTRGQLGLYGALALKRGMPRTHHFAQARSVFAVAAQRCAEVFDPPGSVTLWRLPIEIEEAFDARWEHWLDHADEWLPFFETIANVEAVEPTAPLRELRLVSQDGLDRYEQLRTSAEGRAVPIPDAFSGSSDDLALLALAFGRGSKGALAVPYMREQGS